MKETHEWSWIGRFTDDGGAYESEKHPMSEASAREYIKELQDHEDEMYPVDADGKRDNLHVTYVLRRRPKLVEPEWEEVP